MTNFEFIATTKDGVLCNPQEAIFPIFKELPDKWELIGTGFFIDKNGIFLTANHVLEDVIKEGKQLFHIAALTLRQNEYQMRPLYSYKNICGDIAIGILDNNLSSFILNSYYTVDPNKINIGDKIVTYAYPKTTCMQDRINISANVYSGEIIEYFPNGRDSTMLPNPCYQTNMEIPHGASGGPVINPATGRVVGINSSGLNDNCLPHVSYVSEITDFFISPTIA